MRRSNPSARPAALVAALALLVLLAASAAPAHAGDGWWGGLDDGEAVSLADVIRGPRDYRERTITFFCVFHTADGEFKYYPPNTAFSERRHLNFSVWHDGAAMWEERTFTNDLPFLYLRRTNPQRVELLRLPSFTRLEVTGKIRDIVRGKPAIEVFSFRATGHRFGKTVWKEIMRGRNYAHAGTTQGYQLAARAFKEALQPDLPPVYDMIVRKLLADTLRQLGYHKEAAQYERGETLGLPSLPKPDPGKDLPQAPAFPDDLPQPFNPSATSGARPERPAAPNNVGSPDGDAPTGALPPMGGPPSAPLPPAPLGPDEAAPAGPPPAPSYGGSAPRAPVQPRVRKPRAAPKGAAPRTGIPPKRRVRLSGVK